MEHQTRLASFQYVYPPPNTHTLTRWVIRVPPPNTHTLTRWVIHVPPSKHTHTYTLGIHSRTVLSLEAEATSCPEGENATERMASYKREEGGQIGL